MTILQFLMIFLAFTLIQICFILSAFHCGYIWGRYKISAYQWWKNILKKEE